MTIRNLQSETTYLSPVRLRGTKEVLPEVVPVSSRTRERIDRLRVDQEQRLRPGETARFMRLLDQSTGSLGSCSTGDVGFGGMVQGRDGLMACRGKGRVSGSGVLSADGCLSQPGSKDRVLFLIGQHVADRQLADQMVHEYEAAVKGLDWGETTKVTLQFEQALRVRARDIKEQGMVVMAVLSTNDDVDARELIGALEKASVVPRVVGRLAMQIHAKLAGEEVGQFGGRQKKLKPVAPVGLLGE